MFHLKLAFNLRFEELYLNEKLPSLDKLFQDFLDSCASEELRSALLEARSLAFKASLSASDESALMLKLAPLVEDFLGVLFNITPEILALQQKHRRLAPLYSCKRLFVQRQALKKYGAEAVNSFDDSFEDVFSQSQEGEDIIEAELAFALSVSALMQKEDEFAEPLERAAKYAAWAVYSREGQAKHQRGILFRLPQKRDFQNLLKGVERDQEGRWTGEEISFRAGFALTDPGLSLPESLNEAHYCIRCHHQGKDSCSKGLRAKDRSTETFQRNELNNLLSGCPLKQKISEMNELKAQGYALGSLAVVTVDNPMVAATGHRICNECMKACIYQKQDPVNIPGTETQILKDVLELPWGFEIYSLLTRWNPLNFRAPFPVESTGKKVLVVGMGPAGFTLAHYLLNEGHTVVGVEGLKVEPLSIPFEPIWQVGDLWEELDERLNAGFGGVAEYGITVRWDKNFLKIIRLLLERRSTFCLLDGVRFGSSLTASKAFELGFDHIALCMGTGSPTLLSMPHSLAPGVRQASDFLMALQLTGAARAMSLANLQIRLPIVVLGGGLTAIDTATEALAYYQEQVFKFKKQFEAMVKVWGESAVAQIWTETEKEIAEEFLKDADQCAQKGGTWVHERGGVTLVYRKALAQSPAYRLNHEEVQKALEEGIQILDEAVLQQLSVDERGDLQGVHVRVGGESAERFLPARTLLVAIGTQPNLTVLQEDPLLSEVKEFQPANSSDRQEESLLWAQGDGRAISFFGDLHPSYAGNVVKAMASAKNGFPALSRWLQKRPAASAESSAVFFERLTSLLRAHVVAVNRLTSTIVEIVVKAPLAAEAFQPGQFYRLQHYESFHSLGMEGLALTGASVDKEKGLISTIVLEMGGASSLCAFLKVGEPVVFMGPVGAPTVVTTHWQEKRETVLLIGGGLGNAVLFSIGKALKAQGAEVLYVAGYRKQSDRFKAEEIRAAADRVVWVCEEAPGFAPQQGQNLIKEEGQEAYFIGNMLQALETMGQDNQLAAVDRLLVIGSDGLMAAVAAAKRGSFSSYFKKDLVALASINSPMQCMMKGICGQCLQRHVNPETGEETVVYSCVNQDQPLDLVDFSCLSQRLKQNSVQEKLTALVQKQSMQCI